MAQAGYIIVACIPDVPLKTTLCVQHLGKEVLLCHTSEGIFAVDNLCSHAAQKLSLGKLKGHKIQCPLHSAAFDVRDGSVFSRPASQPLGSYPVRVDGNDIALAVVKT